MMDSSNSAPLRFAIVGCGTIGPTHGDALKAVPAELGVLVGVCDEVEERAAKMAEKYGVPHFTDLDKMIADLPFDVLTVCVPSGHHAKCGVVGAKAGKHIMVEKPIDVSLEAADALINACKENNVQLCVISQHRYSAGMKTLRGWVDSGRLGNMVYGESVTKWYRTQAYYDSGGWRGTWDLDGGGALMNQGVHYVDMLRWIMGPVKSVCATMATRAHERIEVEDIVAATIEFESGAVGTLQASTAFFPGFKQALEVYGSLGTVIVEDSKVKFAQFADGNEEQTMFSVKSKPPEYVNFVKSGDAETTDTGAVTGASDPSQVWGSGHTAHYRDLIDAIHTGREPFMNGQEARNALEVIVAVYQSGRTGQRVTLPL